MSGTSADGVDVAIVQVEGFGLEMRPALVFHHFRPYAQEMRARLFRLRAEGEGSLWELADLGRQVSLSYAAAVNEALIGAKVDAEKVVCVAAHGQTLFHDPPLTIQWLDSALLAAETGCAVVSDFRRADCAAGGEGAPLVPFADYVLFRDLRKSRIIVNLGGIANLTWIAAGSGIAEVMAFDTGPGNCICDHICRKFDPLGPGYDPGGRFAERGRVESCVLEQMLCHGYFRSPPPKSTDGPAMIRQFESAAADVWREGRDDERTFCDELATACAITARSMREAVEQFLPGTPDEVVISGGGTSNVFLMGLLRRELGIRQWRGTEEFGIASEAKEAAAFALLGLATLDGLPANVPSATGARRGVVLGTITPRP